MSYEVNINAKKEYEDNKKAFDIIPKGKYLMMLTNYESKTGKDSGKEYLQTQVTLLEGDYKNRKVFKNFFLFSSEVASKIARAELSGIAVAVGVDELKNVDQIMNKPFYGILDIEVGNNGYPDKNKLIKAEPYKIAGNIGDPIKAQSPKPAAQDQFEDDLI